MDDDATERVEALFTAAAEEFVARRDALVKELRAAGDKTGAAEVKALRRPTVAAWAVNQVVRTKLADVAALRDLGQRLRGAQEGLLTGAGAADLRRLTVERRELVAKLTDAAVALLGPGGAAQRDAIADSFDAAAADPDAAAQALSGRLAKELPKPSGFGDLGIELADLAPTSPSGEQDRAAQRERERLERLRDEAERAQGDVSDATARVERLQAELAVATERLQDARARAERTARALTDAGAG